MMVIKNDRLTNKKEKGKTNLFFIEDKVS